MVEIKKTTTVETDGPKDQDSTTPGLVTPDAPYGANADAEKGIDKAIARDGSGTHQTEPYGMDYPLEAKVEPAMQQVNTRTAQAIGTPGVPAPSGDMEDRDREILEGLAEVEKSRLEAIKSFREDHISRQKFVGEEYDKAQEGQKSKTTTAA